MPTAPTVTARRRAKRWLQDSVTYRTVTNTGGTRADPTGITYGTAIAAAASIRMELNDREDTPTQVRAARELRIWIDPDVATQPEAGMELTVTGCRDITLIGVVGQIVFVERDAAALTRRCVVRIGSDA